MSAETDEIAEAERMQQWGKVAFLRGQLPPEPVSSVSEEIVVQVVSDNAHATADLHPAEAIEDTAPAAPVLDETELN